MKWFNLQEPNFKDYSKVNLANMAQEIQEAFIGHFVEPKERLGIGMSELGKPAVLLALKKLGYPLENGMSVARKMTMLWGSVAESTIIALMRQQGMFVSHEQTIIDFKGIPGHLDCVVDDMVVEIKTMSDGYWNQFTKHPNDDRGYITQLALYMACSGKAGVWLCLNKAPKEFSDNSPLQIVIPNIEDLNAAIVRAEGVIDVLGAIESLEDIFEYMEPPAPVPEVYRGAETGKYLVPTSMKYTPYKEVFYQLEQSVNGYKKPTEYVVGYTTLNEVKDVLLP